MPHPRVLAAVAGLGLLGACQDYPSAVGRDHQALTMQGDVRSGWVSGPGGQPMEVTFEVRRGRAIFEGDIDLGPADDIPTSPPRYRPNYGVVTDVNTWGSGTPIDIKYMISSAFTSSQQQVILDAMNHITSKDPGVVFGTQVSQPYINFVLDPEECSSPVGWQGQQGGQDIKLTSDCASSMGTVAHEILHALGFWHEQGRCDRDTYVEILWANIQSGREYNFDKQCVNAQDVSQYDEGSIMHYPPLAWSTNGQPTIRSLRGLDNLMGQRNGLSTTDASTLQYLFHPPPPTHIDGPSNPPRYSWQTWTVVSYEGAAIRTATWYRDRVPVANWVSYQGCTGDRYFELLVEVTDVYGRSSEGYMTVYPDYSVPPTNNCP